MNEDRKELFDGLTIVRTDDIDVTYETVKDIRFWYEVFYLVFMAFLGWNVGTWLAG